METVTLVISWSLAAFFVIIGAYFLAINFDLVRNRFLGMYFLLISLSAASMGYLIREPEFVPNIPEYPVVFVLVSIAISGFFASTSYFANPFTVLTPDEIEIDRVLSSKVKRIFSGVLISLNLILFAFPILMLIVSYRSSPIPIFSSEFPYQQLMQGESSIQKMNGFITIYFGASLVTSIVFQVFSLAAPGDRERQKLYVWYMLAGTLLALCLLVFSQVSDQWMLLWVMAIGVVGLVVFVSSFIQGDIHTRSDQRAIVIHLLTFILACVSPIMAAIFVFANRVTDFSQNGVALWIVILVINLVTLIVLAIPVRYIMSPISDIVTSIENYRFDEQSSVVQDGYFDEFGQLGIKINQLVETLNVEISNSNMENRRILNQLDRQNSTLSLISRMARSSASIQDLKVYLDEVVIDISRILGYYHVGIYTIDDSEKYVNLVSASSDGGRMMLSRRHKLSVGEEGVVGIVAGTGRPRIIQNVESDTTFLRNLELPRTKSEMAVPLRISGRMLGVLDIQSSNKSDFSKNDQEIMTLIANQISLTIENNKNKNAARLMQMDVDANYQAEWRKRLDQRVIAYRYDRMSIEEIDGDTTVDYPVSVQLEDQMEVPIMVRGQPLGSIVLRRDVDREAWSDDELAFAVEAVNQIVPALENATLLREIEDRIRTESLAGQISSHIQGSPNLESLLRTTVEELSKVIAANRIRMRIVDPILNSEAQSGENQDVA